MIFLVGDRAFKMKRHVHYSFMDFSTSVRREAAIRAELALNVRTAPEIYRRVLPVTVEGDGSLALDGRGEPVEWLLEMARFPDDARLDRVAERGGLDMAVAERLAMAIADLHERAEPRPEAGGVDAMRRVTDGNAADLRSLAAVVRDDRAKALAAATDEALTRLAPLLEARRAAGKVRRCHGDLHLANIVLLAGRRPVLFDCLEFDEELASIDIVYDLAFLLMDMVQRGLVAEARHCLQIWNDRLIDDEGLALLPLAISIRATIRAKVEGFSAELVTDPAERGALIAAALAHLDLAERALAPSRPLLIAIGGLSGTGKSTLARAIAPSLSPLPGAMILRSDVIRKALHGLAPTERLPQAGYAPEVSARVFATIAARAGKLLAAGHSVVCDAVYGNARHRATIEAVAAAERVPFRGFWLEADPGQLVERVSARSGDASDADATQVRRQLRQIETVAVGWRRLDARGGPEQLAATALLAIAEK